ncbi:MAG: exodeoxyribonuclease VII small subunit [Woeseia sp.]|nr:exodeoxyribonuclease VII small subunit [Woeseia sp.]
MDSAKKINLEKSISDLEKLVNELESGDLSLEKAIKKFEEGIKLSRKCQTALKEAEQKIEILLGDDTSEKVTSFIKDGEDS